MCSGIDLLSYCVRKIGNGALTRFWEDVWCGDKPLKTLFPRIYQLDLNKLCPVKNRLHLQVSSPGFRRQPRGGAEMVQFLNLQSMIGEVVLSNQEDSWQWALHNSGYTVASTRSLIDSKFLDTAAISTRWVRCIPIKVNIFIWRLSLNRLPSEVNLNRMGVDIGSILCPICEEDVETINHVFFSCDLAMALWAKLAR
ncbi:RNA-directed DNA polymerase, eukaryota, reverse transcriptase zinc-binding domain protein [Tanacetum coccineum]